MSALLMKCLLGKTCIPQRYASYSTVHYLVKREKHEGTKQANGKISLVILDKDGTLVEFGAGWSEWVRQFSKSLEDTTGLEMGEKLFHLFGFNLQTQKWQEGLMCDNPENIRLELANFLEREGMKKCNSRKIIKDCFHKVDNSVFTDQDAVAIDNPQAICSTFSHFGVKTAICTMDSRVSTNLMLGQLGLHKSFDYILCGDDDHAKPKPNPSNLFHICAALNIDPMNAAFIGDAKRDVEMGRQANVALNIGVLSGVCEREELEPHADIVVPSVTAAMSHLLPEGYDQILREMTK